MDKKKSFTVEIIDYIKNHSEIINNNKNLVILYDLETIMDKNKENIYEEYLVIYKFSKTFKINSMFFSFDILSNIDDKVIELMKKNIFFYKDEDILQSKEDFIGNIYKYLINKEYKVILQF